MSQLFGYVAWRFFGKHVLSLKSLTRCVSLELPPLKQSTCAQNSTSYRGWFQPGARYYHYNFEFAASWIKAFELNQLQRQEFTALVLTKQIGKHAFSLRGACNELKWDKIVKNDIFSIELSLNRIEEGAEKVYKLE